MVVAEKLEERKWCVIENKGNKIFGVIHRPVGVETPPCVIIMHGFASSKHGTNRAHVTLSEKLAERGVASLRFDFRGAGDSEGSLSEISIEDMVSDALSVLNYAETIEEMESIGVFGSSLGGAIAMLASARFGKVRALALWAPVASGELWYRDFIAQNPEKLTEDPKKVLSTYRGIKLHTDFQEQFARMRAAEVLDELDVPLLHMQGEKDATVSLLHQKVYKMHSEAKSTPSKFISYPNTDHQLGVETISPKVICESVAWFKEHL